MKTKILFCLAMLLIPGSILAFGLELIGPPRKERTATNKPYEEIELDSIQECIIRSELDMSEVYGSLGTESELAGLCIRAFSVWVRKYTEDPNLQIKVLALSRGFRNERLLSPDKFFEDDEDDYDEDDYDEDDKEWEEEYRKAKEYRKKAKEYYEKVPFDFINPYQDYDLDSLISRKVALINVESSYSKIFSEIMVRINAIFPDPEDSNSYIQKHFYYEFVLKLIPNARLIFISELILNPDYLVYGDGTINGMTFIQNGYWDLSQLGQFSKPVKYTEKDLPKTLYELFFEKK